MQTEHEQQVLSTGVDVLLAADVVYGDKVRPLCIKVNRTNVASAVAAPCTHSPLYCATFSRGSYEP
jgi:hypothetical protein